MVKVKGFTLLEALAAIAIVGLAVPAFMLLMMSQIDSAATLRNKTIAIWVAENTLNNLRLQRKLEGTSLRDTLKETVEMAGTEWQVVTQPQETEFGALLRYDTAVSLVDDPDKVLVTLNTFIH